MFAFCICFHLPVHDHLVQTGIFKGYCLEFSMGPKKTVPATKDDGNEGQADFDDMVSSTFTYQVLAGGAFGIAGGYMDSTYIEPFGVIFGSSLALLQLLDHQGVVSLCWMDDASRPKKGGKKTLVEEVKEFTANNVHVASGFAAGFVLAYYLVENYQ